MDDYFRYGYDNENPMSEEYGYPFENCAPLNAQQVGVIYIHHITRVHIYGLLHNNAIQCSKKIIDLHLFRIIYPVNISGSNGAFIYYN